MNTSMLSIALAAAVFTPAWRESYSDGQQEALAQKKPLVIVFASGSNAWSKVIRDQQPSPALNQLLKDRYVCVFVDTAKADGKRLAENFAIASDVGMVISDRSGSLQAFWHQGDMPSQSVAHYLQKYADPNVVVTGTETTAAPRNSFYQGGVIPVQRSFSTANC